MLKKNTFMEKLKSGQIAYGCQISSRSTLAAEVIARSGFDFVYVETEHFSWNDESIENVLRAVILGGNVPIVRIPTYDEGRIGSLLDMGAHGLILPHVDTPEQVAAIIDAGKYPPMGRRGAAFGGSKISLDYGAQNGACTEKEFLEWSNQNIPLIPMIESIEAVNNIEKILSYPVDAIRIGRSDLSYSMGFYGEKTDPKFDEAVEHVLACAKKRDIPVGSHATSMNEAQKLVTQGFSWISYGSDLGHLARALSKKLAQLRELKK